jgi:hypothetical protein
MLFNYMNKPDFIHCYSRLNWIQFVERIEPEAIPKQFMGSTPRGRRSIGRQNFRSKDEPLIEKRIGKGPNLQIDDDDDDDDDALPL